MKNKVYLLTHANDSLLSLNLPGAQMESLVQTIDSLGRGELASSRVIFSDDAPGGGMRAVNVDDLRILFRYDPENHTIIVADVTPFASEERLAAFA